MVHEVTVSPKFQIVIPKEVRERYGFRPGQKLGFVEWNGGLRLIPMLELDELQGAFPGLSYDGVREKQDRVLA